MATSTRKMNEIRMKNLEKARKSLAKKRAAAKAMGLTYKPVKKKKKKSKKRKAKAKSYAPKAAPKPQRNPRSLPSLLREVAEVFEVMESCTVPSAVNALREEAKLQLLDICEDLGLRVA